VKKFVSTNCSDDQPVKSDKQHQSSPLPPISLSTTSETEKTIHSTACPDRSKLCGSEPKSSNLVFAIVVILLVLVIICQFGAIFYYARKTKMLEMGHNDLIPLTAAGTVTKNVVAVQEEMEVNEMYNECPQGRVTIEEMYAEINEQEI